MRQTIVPCRRTVERFINSINCNTNFLYVFVGSQLRFAILVQKSAEVDQQPRITVAAIKKRRSGRQSGAAAGAKLCLTSCALLCLLVLIYRAAISPTPHHRSHTNKHTAISGESQTGSSGNQPNPTLKTHSELRSALKTESKPAPTTQAAADRPATAPAMSSFATITTSYGNIKIRFREDKAPKHVAFMSQLIQQGLYNGCVFYRAEPNFVVQGGLKDANGSQRSPTVQNPPLEFELLNKRGTVTMARWEDTNSGAGEFFINLRDSPHLDRHGDSGWALGFTVFGEVVEGMEVAEKIGTLPTTVQGGLRMLNTAVVMESVTLS